MKKPHFPTEDGEGLNVPESSGRSLKQHVISHETVKALREKAVLDSGKSHGRGEDGFNYKNLKGLTFDEAVRQHPQLLNIMFDVVVQVSRTVPTDLEAESNPKHTDEMAPEFTRLLKDAAKWFYRNGHMEHALQACQGALKYLSDDGDLYLLSADIFYKMDNFKAASDFYEQALQCLPEDSKSKPGIRRKLADVQVKLADVFFNSSPEMAVQCYRKALEHAEDYVPALCGLGDIAFYNKDFEVAQEFFERVLDIDSTSEYGVHALNGLANVHVVYRDDDEAESLYHEALMKAPLNLNVLYDMADFQLRHRENYHQAKVYIDRAFMLQPKNLTVMLLKVQVEMNLKDFDTAQVLVERVLQIDPTNKKAYDYYCRLVNGDCFLPPQYGNSFRAVKPDRQSTSRDFHFSLQYQTDPADETAFEDYVIKVAKDSGDRFSKLKSRYDGWLLN